jgi:hypothetical protein
MLNQKELYNHMEEHPEYFPAPSIPPPSITEKPTPSTSLFDKLQVGDWINTRPYIGGTWSLGKVFMKSEDKIVLLGMRGQEDIHREEIDEGDYFRSL